MSGEPTAMATDGRTIGARALATRQRLLDATKKLLARDGVLGLKLVDVTREIGSSPATFYQYFGDIDDALLLLCDEVRDAAAALVDVLEVPWSAPDDHVRAEEFVAAYTAYWDENGAVLRARNLKAEEGDARFRAKRSETQLLIMEALGAIVAESVAAGRLAETTDAVATSAGMLAMLERLTTYRRELASRGSSEASLRTTLTDIVFQTVSGVHLP